ncbi:hypothetical protein [Patulibacter americanus]|nr:hypothetical protein [Patulibacter americanus]
MERTCTSATGSADPPAPARRRVTVAQYEGARHGDLHEDRAHAHGSLP